MERCKTVSLGDVLRSAIEESEMGRMMDEAQVIKAWPMVIGAQIAAKSPRPTVKRGVMTVRIYSAGLRQELTMMRSRLKDALNRVVGKEIIEDLRFTS